MWFTGQNQLMVTTSPFPWAFCPGGRAAASCAWCRVGGGMRSDSHTGVPHWLGLKDTTPVGKLAFSNPVLWHCPSTDLLPSPIAPPRLRWIQGIILGSTCTLHNRFSQLNVTPAEKWVTASPSPSILAPVCPSPNSLQFPHLWITTLLKLAQLASTLLWGYNGSQTSATCVFCIQAVSSSIGSTQIKEHEPNIWAVWDEFQHLLLQSVYHVVMIQSTVWCTINLNKKTKCSIIWSFQ